MVHVIQFILYVAGPVSAALIDSLVSTVVVQYICSSIVVLEHKLGVGGVSIEHFVRQEIYRLLARAIVAVRNAIESGMVTREDAIIGVHQVEIGDAASYGPLKVPNLRIEKCDVVLELVVVVGQVGDSCGVAVQSVGARSLLSLQIIAFSAVPMRWSRTEHVP